MKKLAGIACVIALAIGLAACSDAETVKSADDSDNTGMFVCVEKKFLCYDVVYQKDTKVMYVVSAGEYVRGTFTLLVNPDGSPMIYEGA